MTDRITLLTWPSYISPLTLEGFETEYSVQVVLEIVPSAVELVGRMQTGAPPDVLVPPDYAVRELSAQGRLAALDHAKLPNLRNLEERFRVGRAHDPECRVSITKDWGTTGYIFRTDRIKENPTSWTDFWRLAARWSGCVSVLDSPGEVIGAALKMRGRSYNAASPDALAGARSDLLALRPHLCAFETDYKPLLSTGEVVLSLGWNGDASALAAQGVPVRYVLPSERSQIWEDDWAIAAGSSNPELAHAFLDYVLRPEVSAQEANYTRYATANEAARALLDEPTRNDPGTYPSAELLARLEAGMPIDEQGHMRRAELWREMRGAG